MTDDEYIQGLVDAGYDPAHDDPDDDRNYCVHGRYIGPPGGIDYICGYCEEGITREEFEEMLHEAFLHRAAKQEEDFDKMVRVCQKFVLTIGWLPGLAQGLMDLAYEGNYWDARRQYELANRT